MILFSIHHRRFAELGSEQLNHIVGVGDAQGGGDFLDGKIGGGQDSRRLLYAILAQVDVGGDLHLLFECGDQMIDGSIQLLSQGLYGDVQGIFPFHEIDGALHQGTVCLGVMRLNRLAKIAYHFLLSENDFLDLVCADNSKVSSLLV